MPQTDDRALKQQLDEAKRTAQQQREQAAAAPAVERPQWLNPETAHSFVSKPTQDVMQRFSKLMRDLPLVAQTKNREAMLGWFSQATEQLTKVYMARMQLVAMKTQLSDAAKQRQLDHLQLELKAHLLDMAQLLGHYTV